MFYGCTALTTAQSITATSMGSQCCYQMFYGCGSRTFDYDEYRYVYSGIRVAPTLAAVNMAEECCYEMYRGCYNLQSAQNALSTTNGISDIRSLAKRCFYRMFYECKKLETPPVLPEADVPLAEECYYQMFYECWADDYEIVEGEYRYVYHGLQSAPDIKASVMAKNSCYQMFYGCGSKHSVSNVYEYAGLSTPPRILSTEMAEQCCYQMFYGCENLGSAENVLPVDEHGDSTISVLAKNCFYGMFQGCSSLSGAPVLPGADVELAEGCYHSMFEDCGAKDRERHDGSWIYVYRGLASAPALLCETLANSCYEEMFSGCKNLGSAQDSVVEIMATSAANSAMRQMFSGCELLAAIKIAFSSDPVESNAFYNWTNGVASSGTLHVPAGSAVSAMLPSGWTKSEYSNGGS